MSLNAPSSEQETNQQQLQEIIPALATKFSSTLEQLCQIFELSPIERDTLLLCAGMELLDDFDNLCAIAQNRPNLPFPTLKLIRLLFPEDEHYSLLSNEAPLQQHDLIEIDRTRSAGNTLSHASLIIDPCILNYLLGQPSLDPQLKNFIKPQKLDSNTTLLAPSYQAIAQQIVETLTDNPRKSIQVCGLDHDSNQQVISVAISKLGYQQYRLSASSLPQTVNGRQELYRRWHRQTQLQRCILLINCDGTDVDTLSYDTLISEFIDDSHSPLIIVSSHQLSTSLPLVTFEVPPLPPAEQCALWKHHLGDISPTLDDPIDRLVAQFKLTPQTIERISRKSLNQINSSEPDAQTLEQHLWHQCRIQSRLYLEKLTQRIETLATWEDLLLPGKTTDLLHQIVAQTRQRAKIHRQWEMNSHTQRGMGVVAVFYGTSGTGKTTAAELIAKELNLDLYRIDLGQVASKYIGDTEKHLERVFSYAEQSGSILLFDEADALFGKRSDVSDARDRYANLEVSYLLQRLETYSGLAILTTNMVKAMDNAFKRRLQFLVEFREPELPQRKILWKRVFPEKVPLGHLNYDALADLGVSGAIIRNIALRASHLASEADEPVMMKHLSEAGFAELVKMGLGTQTVQQWR